LGTYGEIAKFCSGAVGAVDRIVSIESLLANCCMASFTRIHRSRGLFLFSVGGTRTLSSEWQANNVYTIDGGVKGES